MVSALSRTRPTYVGLVPRPNRRHAVANPATA